MGSLARDTENCTDVALGYVPFCERQRQRPGLLTYSLLVLGRQTTSVFDSLELCCDVDTVDGLVVDGHLDVVFADVSDDGYKTSCHRLDLGEASGLRETYPGDLDHPPATVAADVGDDVQRVVRGACGHVCSSRMLPAKVYQG